MLKIAIITFHRAINYGAVLQTYALARYLKEIGYDVQVLDYRSSAIEDSYRIKYKFNMCCLKQILLSPFSERKKKEFYNFIKKNIPHTQPLYTQNDLRKEAKKYDYIITGSDQVWNSQWTKGDEAYLLNFCEDKQKISYAASIGKSDILNEEKQRLERCLKNFQWISVREQTGKDLLESFLEKKILVNCDPVALLNKEIWEEIATLPKEKDYILVYMLVKSDSLMEAAIKYGEKKGKQVILINDNIRRKYLVKYKRYISPEQFIGLFCNADCIFTNSFHGTMFSIIFEKEFYVELQKYKGAPNSRIVDLLKRVGIEECILKELNFKEQKQKIDYLLVKEKFNQMKIEAKKYFEVAFLRKEKSK